jgi:hypothetical protein
VTEDPDRSRNIMLVNLEMELVRLPLTREEATLMPWRGTGRYAGIGEPVIKLFPILNNTSCVITTNSEGIDPVSRLYVASKNCNDVIPIIPVGMEPVRQLSCMWRYVTPPSSDIASCREPVSLLLWIFMIKFDASDRLCRSVSGIVPVILFKSSLKFVSALEGRDPIIGPVKALSNKVIAANFVADASNVEGSGPENLLTSIFRISQFVRDPNALLT